MSHNARVRSMGVGVDPTTLERPNASAIPNPISLVVPRPDHQRSTNLYVDVPFQHKVFPHQEHTSVSAVRSNHHIPAVHRATNHRSAADRPAKTHDMFSSSHQGSGTLNKSKREAISCQPTSITFTKYQTEQESIICSRCGRCRCEACAAPRKPCSTGLCGGKYRLSTSSIVDCVSCLCCVKGALYHCSSSSDGSENPSSEKFCSCAGEEVCLRWSCLVISAFPLPCLLCYWPLTLLKSLADNTYEHYSRGCRCHTSPTTRRRSDDPLPTPPASPEKSLLQDFT